MKLLIFTPDQILYKLIFCSLKLEFKFALITNSFKQILIMPKSLMKKKKTNYIKTGVRI